MVMVTARQFSPSILRFTRRPFQGLADGTCFVDVTCFVGDLIPQQRDLVNDEMRHVAMREVICDVNNDPRGRYIFPSLKLEFMNHVRNIPIV